ncbi:MAG: prolipoprotein diacylglyceryl transferase [Planctomycetia bacterium]|nr:prolipoprotein diacylglyceryl transferase [Planctomycetia bacterium]
MLQTLFVIPPSIGGVPLFGFGIFAALWAVWCVVYAILFSRKQGWSAELVSSLGVMALIEMMLIYVVPRIMLRNEVGELIGIAVRGYGVMLLTGIIAGVALSVYRGTRVGMPADLIYSLALWIFVAGMVGARSFYVIEYWKSFQRDSLQETIGAVLNMTEGGLVVFGGLIGALGAILFFARKHKLPLLPLADMAAPGMMLGLAFGRIGCFCNGCCFGDVCEAPWAVEFPAGTPPHIRQVEQGRAFGFMVAGRPLGGEESAMLVPTITVVDPESSAARAGLKVGEVVKSIDGHPVDSVEKARTALYFGYAERHLPVRISTDRGEYSIEPLPGLLEHSRPIHPAQLYASFDAFLATLLLLAFTPLSRRDGETFALFLTVHPISRFLLEEIRIDEPGMFGTQLSISQHISIVLLGLAVCLWLYIERRPAGFAWPRTQAKPTP